MDNLDFSEEEIQQQLALLGYKNIPKHRLREFKQDLDELIRRGEWKSLASSTQINTKSQTATSQPSPPAYTKEKGQSSGRAFFLHAGNADHRNLQGCCDSYAQHSVAQKIRLPPGAPSRLQVEQDLEDTLQSPLTDGYTSTPDTQERCFIKRKVLRKHQGESFFCDESVYSDDSASGLEEQLAELHLSTSPQQDFESESEDVTSQSDTQSSESDGGSLSAFDSYMRGMTQTQRDGDLRPKPKSFIRPVTSRETIKKTDPVAKYFQYKQLWETFKLSGEKDRRALRWEIKVRKHSFNREPKPQRVYVPNSYIVPTEKKRSALRWKIRSDLAGGLLPRKFS
uniref:HYLS1 centriolar and ciliogenesis associated n=1 Tax=Amphilophus citrinellus TaxID=61819 RepID=A0A3Q0RWJ1_AMPCI